MTAFVNVARVMLSIAFSEARQTLMQPRLLLVLLFLPIIFSTLLGIFSFSIQAPARMLWTAPNTPLALELKNILAAKLTLEIADRRAQNLVARNERDLWVRLPEDFDASIKIAKIVKLEVSTGPGNARSADGEIALQSAMIRLLAPFAARFAVESSKNNALNLEALQTDAATRASSLLKDKLFEVKVEQILANASSSTAEASGSSQTAPGMTLMFALLFGAQTGLALQRERSGGTLARLFAAPVGWGAVMFGKLLGNAFILVLQLFAMIAFSSLALGVHWGNIGALLPPVLAFGFMASSFGGLTAAMTRTSAQLTSFSTLAVTVTSALGGLWWPLDVTPVWMQTLAKILPTYWGMSALQDVILRGANFSSVLPSTVILLGFGMLFLVVGSRVFRYE
jgi:ABC-type multidrug transport system permease subunit